MSIITLAEACRQLAIDAKTLRRWLAQAPFPMPSHPQDARAKGITTEHLRLLAQTHHRSLPSLPVQEPAPAPAILPPALLALPERLATMQSQLATLQQQVAVLTRRLPATEPVPALPAAPLPIPTPPAPAAKAPPQPVHVISRVEYAGEGRYVVSCPQCGLLPMEPDTPAWVAWVAQQTSFRFVGQSGSFTAHHEGRVPRGAWRAHRKIRNRTHIVRLAPSHLLTIAILEQAAAALQALLS
jgi:hypothetical protein